MRRTMIMMVGALATGGLFTACEGTYAGSYDTYPRYGSVYDASPYPYRYGYGYGYGYSPGPFSYRRDNERFEHPRHEAFEHGPRPFTRAPDGRGPFRRRF